MLYNIELKRSVVARLLSPNCESVSKIAEETGISVYTLRKWKKDAKKNGIDRDEDREKLSAQDKFLVVLETAVMSEQELSSYAREKGLFVEQIKEWRENCENANGGIDKSAAELDRELRKCRLEKKHLEREVSRKDKALAETAALLTLSKKARAIWGDKEAE